MTLDVGDTGWARYQAVLRFANFDHTPYKAKWNVFAGGDLQLQALRAGALDVAQSSEIPPVFAAADGKANFKVVAVQRANTLLQEVVAPKGSGVTTIAQLKGKKAGYVKNTTAHYFLYKLLQQAGLNWTDIDAKPLLPERRARRPERRLASTPSPRTATSVITAHQQGATTVGSGEDILSGNFLWTAAGQRPQERGAAGRHRRPDRPDQQGVRVRPRRTREGIRDGDRARHPRAARSGPERSSGPRRSSGRRRPDAATATASQQEVADTFDRSVRSPASWMSPASGPATLPPPCARRSPHDDTHRALLASGPRPPGRGDRPTGRDRAAVRPYGAFPADGVRAAHTAGLLTATVGARYGGPGLGVAGTARVLGALGAGRPLGGSDHRHDASATTARRPAARTGPMSCTTDARRVRGTAGPRQPRPRGAGVGLPGARRPARHRARRTADGWSVSGTKRFVTGAEGLDWFLVWATTDEPEPRVGHVRWSPAALPASRSPTAGTSWGCEPAAATRCVPGRGGPLRAGHRDRRARSGGRAGQPGGRLSPSPARRALLGRGTGRAAVLPPLRPRAGARQPRPSGGPYGTLPARRRGDRGAARRRRAAGVRRSRTGRRRRHRVHPRTGPGRPGAGRPAGVRPWSWRSGCWAIRA